LLGVATKNGGDAGRLTDFFTLGFSEFMFWGSFSYDRKGPCHIYQKETNAERKAANKQIEKLNKELEPIKKAKWELNTAMRRMGLRNKEGKKPQWRWNKKNGKIIREGTGGVDWVRYQKHVLLPKLLPFAQDCLESRPETLVMEDGAPCHLSKNQDAVWMNAGILRLIWCENSPDLNMIEPCWWWMKRWITRRGVPKTKATLEQAWRHCWNKVLTQERIQNWIERMPIHIEHVIALDGGNEYRERRAGGNVRPYNAEERQGAYNARKQGKRAGDEEDWEFV